MGGDCSHETEDTRFFGRKAMTNLDSILKSRDSTLPTKVQTVKVIFFFTSHIWMDMRSHIWEIKKTEHQRIDVLELWCWKDSSESLGLLEDKTSQSQRKSTLNIH